MLVQMLKEIGYHPIVGVVGSKHKVEFCKSLGADYVIDKSSCSDMWTEAQKLSPGGYVAIFDANGVETIGQSYEHLSRCGRLVIYGFHSNLPKASHLLSPLQWIRMIYRVAVMPKFDTLAMVLESKGILGFNLSFFSEEHELINQYFAQIIQWIEKGKISAPSCTVNEMKDIGRAHEMIQSGSTVGKLVIRVPVNTN
jgi:NADPH:quinone reductase-like Zn-dependent oxidoreductase